MPRHHKSRAQLMLLVIEQSLQAIPNAPPDTSTYPSAEEYAVTKFIA